MIIGGSGSAGKETLGILLERDFNNSEILFYDDNSNSSELIFDTFPIISSFELLLDLLKRNPSFCIAIGNTRRRESLYNKFVSLGGKPENVISNKSSSLSSFQNYGIIIQPGVVISYHVEIGKSCMLHANTVIGHKVNIGDFVSISPLVSIVGPCEIGNHCFIGAGSIILPHLKIGNNVVIPAGSIVTTDICDFDTFTKSP